jgi:hypothetical protein
LALSSAAGADELVRLAAQFGPTLLGYQTLTEDAAAEVRVDPDRAAVERLVEAPDAKGCRGWRGSFDKDGYPRAWWQGRYVRAGRLLYGWQRGEIPKGWTLDHTCRQRWCMETAHYEPITRAEHARREAVRKRQDLSSDVVEVASVVESDAEAPAPVGSFAVALFAAIDRPAVDQRTVSLDELRQLLGRFEVLQDKRRGRCWSPTKYADGASSRGNAGVEAVSCLVFDCDRVPPDEERLADVCWLGHTTHSHTPLAPRWRVVIPLSAPVPAVRWSDVWRRARAALCPEADPACKDPSRAYWLPSHNGGVTAKATCHEGTLLDPNTLPALPVERRPRSAPRKITVGDERNQAYMRKVTDNVAIMVPHSGRNAALNRAAWTLGRWVAAGMLEQTDVEDELYTAAEQNGLAKDDGPRRCWATIRSGLSAGLREPISLEIAP